MIPLWGYAAGGVLLSVVAFGAGWQVREWRCESAELKAVNAAVKRGRAQQELIHLQADNYEQEKADAVIQTNTHERELRTIYRDVKVPTECAAPVVAVRVLERAVADANARARGEPGATVPTPASTADPSG